MAPPRRIPEAAAVARHELGAIPLVPDRRDIPMASLASVRSLVAALPPAIDLSGNVAGIYDQGDVPACACYSAAAMQSMFEMVESRQWLGFDALECYRSVGGNGAEGVESHDVLDFMQKRGLRQVETSRRYRIGSYALVALGGGGPIEVVKAALAAGRPAVLAMLLPLDWGRQQGQSQGDAISSSYHQVCMTGYDAERVYFVNSQGVRWGDNGFGSVPWGFVTTDEQTGFSYAYTAMDAIDDDLRGQEGGQS